MKVLVIATSPLQVQNAIQFIRQTGEVFEDCCLAQVTSNKEDDNERSLLIARKHEWGYISQFPPFRPTKSLIDDDEWQQIETLNRREYVERISAFFSALGEPRFEKVVLGDYRPMSFRQFLQFTAPSNPEVILVDDGSISRYVMRYRDVGTGNEEATRGLLPHLGPEDPFRIMEPTSLTYFTIYQEPVAENDRIIQNTQFLHDDYTNLKVLDDEVWICGTNHVEANLARANEYAKLCETVRKWFPKKRIVYFPHRREDETKIQSICRKIRAEHQTFKYGLEEYIAHNGARPHKLIVFGSTVADTLSRAFRTNHSVLVVVPRDNYFTEADRADHVKHVIVDNIRSNETVDAVSIDGANIRQWDRGRKDFEEVGQINGPSHRDDKPLFENIFGAKSIDTVDGWTRLEETKEAGPHGVVLGTFQPKASGEGFFHAFTFRTEERYGFKLRVSDAENPARYVETITVLDKPMSKRKLRRFGSIAVEVDVFPDRTSVVSVIFKVKTANPVRLQLLALVDGREIENYSGFPGAGFSIGKLTSKPLQLLNLPIEKHRCSVQTARGDRSAFLLLRVAEGQSPIMICLHEGVLGRTGLRKLHAPLLNAPEIVCLLTSASRPKRGNRKKRKNRLLLSEMLTRCSPLLIKRSIFSSVSIASDAGVFRARIPLPIALSTADFRSGRVLIRAAHESTSIRRERFTLLQ